MNRVSLAVCVGFLSVFAVGCGNGNLATYPVEGKIEYADGSTPKFGTIEFYQQDKKINARGKISDDGTFTLGTYTDDDGAVEGEHKVVIHQVVTNHLSAKYQKDIIHNHGKVSHTKYRDYKTSDLKCTVTKGTNKVTLKIIPDTKQ